MDYDQTVNIIRTALNQPVSQCEFARQTAERWLAHQPGHLTISVLLAEALMLGGDRLQSLYVLKRVIEVDPEHEHALELKARIHDREGDSVRGWATAAALKQVAPDKLIANRRLARIMAHSKPLQVGQDLSGSDMDFLSAIPTLKELEDFWRDGNVDSACEKAIDIIEANPRLVKAHLIVGDCLMSKDDEVGAIEHIHQAACLDPGGEVARRLWSSDQPYIGAWPPAFVPGSSGPLPHAVAVALGLNLLPAPQNQMKNRNRWRSPSAQARVMQDSAIPIPPISAAQEALIDIQAEVNRLNGRRSQGSSKTGTRPEMINHVRLDPIYVLAASKMRLVEKYGMDGWEQIDNALQTLAKAAESRLKIPSGVLYIDDAKSLASFRLDPVDPMDPWAVKNLFQQMDHRLGEQDKEIGWLLLVGGPDIIAFHRLPNPTDDTDLDVPSDNPYGCVDDNYFLPKRAVGRLPDGDGNDPTLLLKAISVALAAHHAEKRAQKGWFSRLWERITRLFHGRKRAREASFGYTASVWRKASLEVFSQIGSARRLRVSPPLSAIEFDQLLLGPSRYGYFNLHGIADGAAWYGQRDPTFPADYPSFPVALRPQDIGLGGRVPEVVLSEACYGAHIDGKNCETALALKFLSAGAQMVIGSTCIAYGGLNAQLEGADLLAQYFWRQIIKGRSGGRALQQAKVLLANALDERQGYLDGEDQKTLLSFVFYGDPSLTASPDRNFQQSKIGKQTWKELTECPPTVCAKEISSLSPEAVPEELVEQVRSRVARYLPGMERAKLVVSKQQMCEGHECDHRGGARLHAQRDPKITGKTVITLQKLSKEAGESHEQVVRVTVDKAGKMLKLAVSK